CDKVRTMSTLSGFPADIMDDGHIVRRDESLQTTLIPEKHHLLYSNTNKKAVSKDTDDNAGAAMRKYIGHQPKCGAIADH
ncbi:hypothetical protein ACJMK2_042897, partial [Sinanodonta woodiana]